MQMRNPTWIAVAVALFAAGCSFEPKYDRPAAPVAATFPSSGVYATQPAAVPGRSAGGEAAADIGWREVFADARLQQIIEIALANNRDLRVSLLNVDAARAQYRITSAQLFPTLNAVGGKTRSRTPANL